MRYCLALLAVVAMIGCRAPVRNNIPPAAQLMHPGPGVDGPGPGVMMLGDAAPMSPFPAPTSQVGFVGPDGMQVAWDVSAPGLFDSEPLVVPGRYNFPQGAIYRLKLTNVPGRPGVELYPTLEVGPATPRTDAYLAHAFVPVQFTEEDIDQVLAGNFVTKVVYLPDPEYQELAYGVQTLVSTRLDLGVDPIVEADRLGSIMAIIRLGNKDLETPGGEAVVGAGGGMMGPGYGAPGYGAPGCGPNGGYGGVTGVPPQFMAGGSVPQYGMPYVGTPIGLPGPPHIPLGHQAGLQQHVMRNHTFQHIPGPTEKVNIHVKQSPGFIYPKPASKVFIHESSRGAGLLNTQPLSDSHQSVPGQQAGYGAECTDCQ